MKPIYKVVDADLTRRIESELNKVDYYMQECLNKAKNVSPDIENIAFNNCSLTGKHMVVGVMLSDGSDTSLYKKWGNSGGSTIFTPKRNTKAGKELSKKLDFIGKSVLLFDCKQFEEELGYNPSKREVFGSGYLTVNYLRFGYTKVNGNMVFIYRGYNGYEPTDKAEEITISEYNEIFKK